MNGLPCPNCGQGQYASDPKYPLRPAPGENGRGPYLLKCVICGFEIRGTPHTVEDRSPMPGNATAKRAAQRGL